MGAEERKRLELARLVAELTADVAALESTARLCAEARSSLAAPSRAVLAMVAVDLHRYYTAIENILERIERCVGMPPPPAPTWHRDLLIGATRPLADARPAILSASLVAGLEKLLAFRHFFRHAYVVEFDPSRLTSLVDEVQRIHSGVAADLRRFTAHLQATIDGLRGGS